MSNTGEPQKSIFVMSDDEQIKALLIEAGITLERPRAGEDFCHAAFDFKGMYWIVTWFIHPGNSGYVAYGVLSTPKNRKELATMLIQSMKAICEDGDPYKSARLIPPAPPEFN